MSAADLMTCEEFVELVTDYLEGAMSEDDRARFERHLMVCRGCVNHIEQMRRAIEALGRLRAEDVSEEARARLLEAFRGWKR